ncbi:MAG: T9SS type A sorting domain-containing protein [Bacteroidia bacterium]
MKKLYFLIAAFFLVFSINAQYSMSNFHNVAPGDMSTSTPAADTLAQEGPGGANQTWNFSTLNLGTASSSTYVSPSSTPYAASFPNATVAAGSGSTYDYLKCNSTSYSLEGGAQPNSTVIYSNDQLLFTYPFTYNSVVNDNFSGTIVTGSNGTLTGTSATTGDGYGTLILPGATLSNVLRVKTTYNRTDNFGAYTIDYYSEVYLWYSAASKYPLFSITRFATNFFGSITWTKSVSMNASVVGINNADKSLEFNMFPNPGSGEVFLSLDPGKLNSTKIEITDMLGKIVYSSAAAQVSRVEGNCLVNTAGFEKGTYFVRVSSDKESTVQKLLIQ